jgi:hypothetical protein
MRSLQSSKNQMLQWAHVAPGFRIARRRPAPHRAAIREILDDRMHALRGRDCSKRQGEPGNNASASSGIAVATDVIGE